MMRRITGRDVCLAASRIAAKLVVAKLLGGFHDDDQRLGTRARAGDHAAYLAGLAHQRLGRGHRHHDLARGGRLEVAIGARRADVDHDLAAGKGLRSVRAELPLYRPTARDLDDQPRLMGHGLTLAGAGAIVARDRFVSRSTSRMRCWLPSR